MHHAASRPGGLGVVFAAPFAEEMNKSRHVVAQTARRLALAGHSVLSIDLKGCGDSSGTLDEATWDDWRQDIGLAVDWMRARGPSRVVLWGFRLGAMLAAQAAVERPEAVVRCLLWQPVSLGETHLAQFLRLRVANAMFSGQKSNETGKSLRARLGAGETLEVAGYSLCPKLAQDLEGLDLAATRPPCPVDWVEVAGEAGQPLSAATVRVAEGWRRGGTEVHVQSIVAQPFWAATNAAELVQCEALVDTSAKLAGAWV